MSSVSEITTVSEERLSIANEAISSPSPVENNVVWEKTMGLLQKSLDPQIFAAWIKPLSVIDISVVEDDETGAGIEVALAGPNKFSCDHIRSHYGDLISKTFAEALSCSEVSLRFQIVDKVSGNGGTSESTSAVRKPVVEKMQGNGVAAQSVAVARRKISQESSNLNPKYNFSNFVVGSCNQFAHAAALRVAESPGTSYNPLFIYGGVGLGKTHLVNALGNAARRRGKNVLLVSSETFLNELISALKSNQPERFKDKFRSLDVLIIDDIQFIIGKERTQEEFFHTFNALHERRSQIVITADKVHGELDGLEERLRTRFASGLSADLQAPDFETRVAILIKKAEPENIELSADVARFLAEKIDTNVRELEGALNRLKAMSSLHNIPITMELAETALRTIIPQKSRLVTIELIQKTVAEEYSLTMRDLLGKRRTQNIAFPRQIAMYLCRKLTTCSYPEIGGLFGGRDHSTVIHANKVTEEKMRKNPELKRAIERLEQRLRGH